MASDRHRDRLSLGSGAILSLNVAADMLPWRDDEARVWLVEQGLVREVCGRRVVVWGQVVHHVDGLPEADGETKASVSQQERWAGRIR